MCRACVPNIFGSVEHLDHGDDAGANAAADSASAAGGTIFQGGTIVPMTGSQRTVEALAVADGKIVAAGSAADISAFKTSATKIVDLDGRTLLPGFIDAHQHTLTGALMNAIMVDVSYDKYKTRQGVLDTLKAAMAKTAPGAWLYATGYDNILQGGNLSMEMLDEVSKTTPIWVWYMNMHTGCANSAAFAAAKIPDDVGIINPGGGHFARDPNGKLTGVMYEEPALRLFLVGMPKLTPQFVGNAFLDWMRVNSALGNTSIHEAGVLVFGNVMDGYAKVAAVAPVRASASFFYDNLDLAGKYARYGVGAQATQIPDTMLTLYAIKIVGDGSNQEKTAFQTQPYLNTTSVGQPNFGPEELKQMVANVAKAGWPISIHANGDATIEMALDAIEAAYGPGPPPTGINRIEHCTMARPDQLTRMKRLGVQPSFLMNHVSFWGAAYRDTLFGPPRSERMDAAGDCVREGLPFTLHTDAPCSTLGTLRLIQTAVTRRCLIDGSVVGAEQAISVDDALKAVTINAAAQIGLADRLGTLEPGKLADLVALDANPYEADPDKIMAINVTGTWVGGKQAFGA